jgi:hypothetical protein
MKTARLITLLGAIVLGLLVVKPASAGMLQGAKITLSDPRPQTSNSHTLAFTTNTAGDFEEISFEYCTQPSGSCSVPTDLNTSAGSLSSSTGAMDGTWTLSDPSGDTNSLVFQHPGSTGESFNTDEVISFTVGGITNHNIGDCNAAGNSSTDTCYVTIVVYQDLSATTEIDRATASITVAAAVTVTARVDPTFTFVVTGVGADTVATAITTSVSTAFNTLPFTNLTAGTPRYAAHKLNVTTNTQSGYTVSIKMVVQMIGVYSANNIDPFIGNGAANGSPQEWLEPTGTTPNTNTGWIGVNLTDNDVSGWSGANTEAGDGDNFIPVDASSEYNVMLKTSSDNGSVPDYATYGIEANVYQPADTYTGTLYYNALSTY